MLKGFTEGKLYITETKYADTDTNVLTVTAMVFIIEHEIKEVTDAIKHEVYENSGGLEILVDKVYYKELENGFKDFLTIKDLNSSYEREVGLFHWRHGLSIRKHIDYNSLLFKEYEQHIVKVIKATNRTSSYL